MNSNTVINFTNVSFSYGSNKVLSDVNFEIQRNDSLCVVGPNGGGKSTLLKLMLGLLKPDTGTITILENPPDKARMHIGYMPQFLYCDFSFPVNVMDVVLMGRKGSHILGFHSKTDKQIAMDKLEELNVADLYNRPFSDLSGGQRQRVLIARALVGEPEIILLDEPTANVDPVVETQFYEILGNLSHKITVLTVSHDLGVVSEVVDRVLCVNRYVKVHPTSSLSGDMIKDIYGDNVKMIRHDHCCSEGGHTHV